VVLMGVGAVGMAVGGIFGIRAINKNKEADDHCSADACFDDEGEDLNDQAQRAALVSNIAFIAGGAAAVGGLIFYLTAPDDSTAATLTAKPLVGGAQLSLGGSF
jgi:hypothetical protein